MQPFSLNQTGTLLPRQLAHFVSAIDMLGDKDCFFEFATIQSFKSISVGVVISFNRFEPKKVAVFSRN